MNDPRRTSGRAEIDVTDLVIEKDTGARSPYGFPAVLLIGVALAWSLFQIWIASPLQFMLGGGIFNETESRSIHLAFGLFLCFIAYPATPNSPRHRIPVLDWLLAMTGAYTASYLYFHSAELALRPGIPTDWDIGVGVAGILVLLEAARRSLGWPMVVIAAIFLCYCMLGSEEWMPDILAHKGASFSRLTGHQWLASEGVFGVALGVSASFVFLFVLFGSLLEKAGAANFFIQLAFSLLGHLRGGPAKAAVLASAMNGMMSGSSIANTVTTGTFTIPLMKRVGFSSEKAGAIETAASCDGQIMPPVMGAAVFVMVDYVGLSYHEIIKHAIVPAALSYLGLLYIVHLEALKYGMQGLERPIQRNFMHGLLISGITLCSIILFAGALYYGIAWIKDWLGEHAAYAIIPSVLIGYLLILRYSARFPDLEPDDPDSPVVTVPRTWQVFRTGMHFLLPLVVLVWSLMVERLSPGLSAFWACMAIVGVLLTQRVILAFFRGETIDKAKWRQGMDDLKAGLMAGARNMIGICVATAAAGIIVGSVSLTGLGQHMVEIVEVVSGGSLLGMLALTAVICLILGMGMPTTANYIIVASLMAGVVMELGQRQGLLVPPIAIHLFVFYFGIMADITPPVGIASFAAAAISRGDPIRTGVQAFVYAIRTAILPFFFIFNNKILLIDVDSVWEGAYNIFFALVGMMLFSSGLQGYFYARNRWYESLAMLILCTVFVLPSYWLDFFYARYEKIDPLQINEAFLQAEPGARIRMYIAGEDNFGDPRHFYVRLHVPEGKTGWDRLQTVGLSVAAEEGRMIVEGVTFNSDAEQAGLKYGNTIERVYLPAKRPAREWAFLPGIFGVVCLFALQYRRRKRAHVMSIRR